MDILIIAIIFCYRQMSVTKSVLSAITLLTAGSIFIFWRKYLVTHRNLLERDTIKEILVSLRKRFFSTLREISFIVQNLKSNPGFDDKQLTKFLLNDEKSVQNKLDAIQNHVLEQYKISNSNSLASPGQDFEYSCEYYSQTDMEIKLLLQQLKSDMQMAFQGSIQSYVGPLPNISSEQTFQIYKQITKMRMNNIEKHMTKENPCPVQILRNQYLIQEYLQMRGLKHQQESSEKILLTLVEYHFKNHPYFQLQIENLQSQLWSTLNSDTTEKHLNQK